MASSAETKSDTMDTRPPTQHRHNKLRGQVFLLAFVAALGGLIFGFDIGGSGGTFVMDGFREHFGWPPLDAEVPNPQWVLEQQGWINALFTLGALVGAVPSGSIADWIGRKYCVIFSAALFTCAASVQTGAVDMTMMYVGRFFGGMAIGMLSAVVPVYIAECSPENFRGKMSTLWQLAVTTGIVLAGIVNIPLANWEEGWRLSYGGNVLFSFVLFVLMWFMPESPRWLVAKDRTGDAEKVLRRLRFENEIAAEMAEMDAKVTEEQAEGEGSWLDLLRTENCMLHRTLLGAGLQIFQQLSGINAIMFFAPVMFSRYFGTSGSLYGTLAINIVNHFATYITFLTVDRFGRVPLMISSGLGMCVAHTVVACLAAAASSQAVGIAIIAFSCGFVVFFAYGWGPVVWTVCSEIYPMKLRGKGISVSTAANWGMASVVGKLFPIISAPNALDLVGTFGLFAGFCLVGSVLFYFYLPETANATLEEVDGIFAEYSPKLARAFWAEARRYDKPLELKIASRTAVAKAASLDAATWKV